MHYIIAGNQNAQKRLTARKGGMVNHYRVLSEIKAPPETLNSTAVAFHWQKFLESLSDKEIASVRWWLDCGNGYRVMLSPLTAWRKWQIEADEKLKKSEKRRAAI